MGSKQREVTRNHTRHSPAAPASFRPFLLFGGCNFKILFRLLSLLAPSLLPVLPTYSPPLKRPARGVPSQSSVSLKLFLFLIFDLLPCHHWQDPRSWRASLRPAQLKPGLLQTFICIALLAVAIPRCPATGPAAPGAPGPAFSTEGGGGHRVSGEVSAPSPAIIPPRSQKNQIHIQCFPGTLFPSLAHARERGAAGRCEPVPRSLLGSWAGDGGGFIYFFLL